MSDNAPADLVSWRSRGHQDDHSGKGEHLVGPCSSSSSSGRGFLAEYDVREAGVSESIGDVWGCMPDGVLTWLDGYANCEVGRLMLYRKESFRA